MRAGTHVSQLSRRCSVSALNTLETPVGAGDQRTEVTFKHAIRTAQNEMFVFGIHGWETARPHTYA